MVYFVPEISYRNTNEMKLVLIHKSPIRASLRKTVDCVLWDFSIKKLVFREFSGKKHLIGNFEKKKVCADQLRQR